MLSFISVKPDEIVGSLRFGREIEKSAACSLISERAASTRIVTETGKKYFLNFPGFSSHFFRKKNP